MTSRCWSSVSLAAWPSLPPRAQELHTCSELARFVAPAAARALQDLFDASVNLVDVLDHGAWRQLAALRPAEALDVVTSVRLPPTPQTLCLRCACRPCPDPVRSTS